MLIVFKKTNLKKKKTESVELRFLLGEGEV